MKKLVWDKCGIHQLFPTGFCLLAINVNVPCLADGGHGVDAHLIRLLFPPPPASALLPRLPSLHHTGMCGCWLATVAWLPWCLLSTAGFPGRSSLIGAGYE